MNEAIVFTGRRISKTFALPLDLVVLIEDRAKEIGTEHSKIAEALLVKGLQAEARAEENPVVEDFARQSSLKG